MDCPMCLRGGPGQGEMDARTLGSLLRHVKYINEVTFTGGEPSLAIPAMRKFYAMCGRYDIPVHAFYIATNGKRNQKELAVFALEQWEKADDKEICAVSLSIDGYHEPVGSGILKGLSFYSCDKERAPGDDSWIAPAGSAERNGLYSSGDRYISRDFSLEPGYDGAVYVETLYLSTNGWIYPDANLSFEEMDDAIGDPDLCPAAAMPAKGCAARLHEIFESRTKRG